MPRLKKSAREKFLDCISKNLRICCKIFGAERISLVLCVSVRTVYSRIEKPAGFNADELFRISEYIGISPDDFTRPLTFVKGGEKT